MATKVRGGPPTKEKRGTSPSQPAQQKGPTTQRGKSPITPKSPSPTAAAAAAAAAAKRSTSTSPSARNVPNYLKPTRTTGPESSSNPVKKIPSNDTTLKPVMSRRKSLDKPLPPSPVPKTRISAIAKDMRSSIPSSPSSARANTSSSSSKATVGGRIGKARSFNAEKESRVLQHVKKVENEASGTKGLSTKETINEVADNTDSIACIDHNNAIDDTPQGEAIAEKVEEFDRVSEDHHKDINEDDDNERVVIVEPEPEIEVEEVKIDESSVTPKDETENKNLDHPIVHETPNNNKEEHEEPLQTCCKEEEEEEDIENASEEKEVEVEAEVETKVEVEEEEKKESEEVVEQGRQEEVEKKESETVKEEVKKVEENNNNTMKKKVIQGKKEMSVVSNDVIEETATKLREQRVNRVKALAGAFETVISNQ